MVDYCVSRFRHKQEEKLYRTYITDALMVVANNTAHAFGGNRIEKRYADFFEPQDERTGTEIAVDVMRRAGLTFGG